VSPRPPRSWWASRSRFRVKASQEQLLQS
jgi:hypothetical protein